MAQGPGIVTDAKVARDNCHESGRIAQGLRSRQVNGVQRAHRFDGKAASRASQDRFRDAHNVRTPGKALHGEQSRALLLSRDPSREAGSKHCAASFRRREGRRDPLPFGAYRGFGRRIALKQGRDEGA